MTQAVVDLAKVADSRRGGRPRIVCGRGPVMLHGSHRKLTLEEQLGILRRWRSKEATPTELAREHGISIKTFWRYATSYVPFAPDEQRLAKAIEEWADQREIGLTLDDIATLIYAIGVERASQS